MTEKRFTIFGEWHKDCVIDEIRDNTGEYVTIGRVVDLLNENEELNSIKKFADRNGICIFNIDEAFRRCWQDNAKLVKENEQLKEEIKDLNDVLARYEEKELQRND